MRKAGILRSGCFHDVENDILLVEKEGVLTVTQDGRSYLALRWKLTEEVVSVVRTAIGFGLSKLWQAGHPKGRQSSHISFSRTQAPASWVFALGLEACPPRLRKITFNKRLLPVFAASDLEWTCRKAGGNIFIPPERLTETLAWLGERLPHQEGAE